MRDFADMNSDPIVEEIHQTRQKIWEECGGDLDRFLNRLRGAKKQDRSRVVSTTSLPAEAYVKKSTEVVVRGLVGAIPYVGTLLNEAIFDLRARLKQERLEKFVEYLADSLQTLEHDKIDVAYIQSAEFIDFPRRCPDTSRQGQSGGKAEETGRSTRRPIAARRRYAFRRSLSGSVDCPVRHPSAHFGRTPAGG